MIQGSKRNKEVFHFMNGMSFLPPSSPVPFLFSFLAFPFTCDILVYMCIFAFFVDLPLNCHFRVERSSRFVALSPPRSQQFLEIGSLDIPLNDEGERDSHDLGKHLRRLEVREKFKFEAIYSSALKRAVPLPFSLLSFTLSYPRFVDVFDVRFC